ncbi:hypothetical protein V2O64_19200 [Verrucomicrobiaceae bacterium 227]
MFAQESPPLYVLPEMRRFAAIALVIFGIFLLWHTLGLFFDGNEGGRLVESSYDKLTFGPDAIDESKVEGGNMWIEMLVSQGRRGFDLLDKSIILLIISGIIIIVLGMIFYPSKNWLATQRHISKSADSSDSQ